jgi:hypothetical protein
LESAGDGAQGAGDLAGTAAQVGFRRLDDAQVFLNLPASDEQPSTGQQGEDKMATPVQFHGQMSLSVECKKTIS